MNEVVFLLQLFAVLGFLSLSLRLGKTALASFVALSGVLANLFVVKQTVLFGMHVTCSDVFAVGGILGLNLIQELYGKQAARSAIRSSLLALVLYATMSYIHLIYTPSQFDETHAAFQAILSSTPRIVAASIGVYYLVQRLDVVFFGVLRGKIVQFVPRVFLSLLLSQALDTVLFSFFGLYGLVASLFDIIVVSFAIKCAVIACSSSVAGFLKRFAKEELIA